MFAPAFGRVVRSSSATCAAPVRALRLPGLLPAHQSFQPIHQRRLSSSKPSVPPNKQKKAAEKVEEAAADSSPKDNAKSDSKNKREAKVSPNFTADSSSTSADVLSTLPFRKRDIMLASFFRDHRPLEVSDDIFLQFGPQLDEGWNPELPVVEGSREQYIYDPRITANILAGALRVLESNIDVQEEARADAREREEALARLVEQPPTELSEESITQWAERLNYFYPPPPPPPPVAFDRPADSATQETQHVTEVTIPQRLATFREHVHRRRGGMFLISVKRQRKLKMKKHKYKKLMKRTRLERRKLDRT